MRTKLRTSAYAHSVAEGAWGIPHRARNANAKGRGGRRCAEVRGAGLGGFGQGRTGEQEPDGSRCWIDGRGAVLGASLRARVYVKCKYTVQYAMCIIQYASVALLRRRRHEYIHEGDEIYTIAIAITIARAGRRGAMSGEPWKPV